MSVSNIALGLLLGSVMSIYIPLIAQSGRVLGSAVMANVPFFFIAFVTSVAIALATGHRMAQFGRIAEVPPVQLAAGVMSACLIIGTSFLVPRVGIGAFFILVVAGQVLTGMMFSQLGLFGAPQADVTLSKLAGAVMVIGGVWLTISR